MEQVDMEEWYALKVDGGIQEEKWSQEPNQQLSPRLEDEQVSLPNLTNGGCGVTSDRRGRGGSGGVVLSSDNEEPARLGRQEAGRV